MSAPTFVTHSALHSLGEPLAVLGRNVTRTVNILSGNEIPPPDALFHLGVTGMIDERSMQKALLGHGIALTVAGPFEGLEAGGTLPWITDIWNQYYFSLQELPTPQEIFVLTNRGLFAVTEMDRLLERKGFQSEAIRAKMANLRFEIPGSSDLVRFSVRHVFEPDLIERLGYNDEFRPILDFWHRLQGLNYPLFSGPFREQITKFELERGLAPGSFLRSYESVGLEDPTWAQAFWFSHWVVPSATQAYEMYFRLRPDRNRNFDPPLARDLNFGLDDLNLLLRANDYPPRIRAALAAIAHRVPGIRFLRQLRATEVYTKADVTELLLRQGYSAGDAATLAESVERNDRDQRRRQIETQAKGQLAKYWELGAIDNDEYRQLLIQHGLQPQDAQAAVELANLDLKFKRLQQIVQFVRRQMISGAINGAQAADQLRQAGVVNERVQSYIQDWQLEVASKHKLISAQKAVQWACKGLITVNDLVTRLDNLGYRREDVAGLVAEASLCQASLANRAAAQADRAARQTERALKSQQRDAARAIIVARRQLAAHGSPAQLRKWFCEGHLGEAELYSRLRFLNWPDADITRLIGDCKAATGGGRGGQRGGAALGG